MEAKLSPARVADLTGMSARHIRRLAQEGKFPYEIHQNKCNRPEYLIPLTALPDEAQLKYYAQQRAELAAPAKAEVPGKTAKTVKPFDHYTEEDREEIVFWKRVLGEWEKYRQRGGMSAAELDERFIAYMRLECPEREFSIKTLYRKRKALAEGDLDGLVDGRGKGRRGKTSMPPKVKEMFVGFLLQETKLLNIQDAMRSTEEYFQLYDPDMLPLPSYSSFRRVAQEIPHAVLNLGVMGEKALKDENTPYVRRDYASMCSNDWWVADNHTFDVMTRDMAGNKHRLYLTAFIDARSGIFTGWYVSENPSAQSTLLALRRGIQECGIPVNLLTDNGSEFLAEDVGGRGHRTRKKKDGGENAEKPPTIMQHLGINFHCALVRNAQAKPIERRFLDVKGQFSRLWKTYTGGNVTEKPECLKKVLKQGALPTDAEFKEAVDILIRGHFNQQPYRGQVKADWKYSRQDVFHLRIGEQRRAGEEDLSLMMMRTTRPQTVGQRGVHVEVHGVRFDYFTQEFLALWQKKRVYVRYDPDHLRTCRVYTSPGDQFVAELPLDTKLALTWDATDEEVAEAARYVRQYNRKIKEMLKASRVQGIDQQSMLQLRLAASKKRLAEYTPPETKAPIRLEHAKERKEIPLLAAAGGGGVDIFAITRSAERLHAQDETED